MKLHSLLVLAMTSLIAAAALSQDNERSRTVKSFVSGKGEGPDLQFSEDGKDLLVRLMVDGPAARQVAVTDYTVDDGRPQPDQPPIGVDKPRRPPTVLLRYLVIINRDLPGFVDGGLIDVPTPPEERREQRQGVTWRLPNFRKWDFRRVDATFHVRGMRFEASSEQLRQAWPKIKKTVDDWDRQMEDSKGMPAP